MYRVYCLLVGIFFIITSLFLECTSNRSNDLISPNEMYSKGIKHLEGEGIWIFPAFPDYERATEYLERLIDNYPYSEYATKAQLRLAEIHQRQKEFEEAEVLYERFIELHPVHPEVPYAHFQTGEIHFEQIRSHDRDQNHTKRALEHFRIVLGDFPESEYASKAKERVKECRLRLAKHELYVIRFYIKRKQYKAAWKRLEYLEKWYSDTGVMDEAKRYMESLREKWNDKRDDAD